LIFGLLIGSDPPVAAKLPQPHWDFVNVRNAVDKSSFYRNGRSDWQGFERAVFEMSQFSRLMPPKSGKKVQNVAAIAEISLI
jgi:hypothetical protein